MPISNALLATLDQKRRAAYAGGGEGKLAERRKKGILTARDRLAALFQENTFMEWGLHAQHDCHNFGMEGKSMPGDGVITGVGYVDGRPVAAFSQDFTVGGGALGRIHAKKMCDIMDYAQKSGIPLIGINDSGGARIQEGDDSLSGYGQVFFRNVELSGLVPQISIIAGPCAGGAAYSPALTDFIIMTRTNSSMFICGPEVIKAATGQSTTMEEIGGAAANAAVSGNVHFVAEDDAHALQIARKLLSFLPSNNVVDPPHLPTPTVDMSPDNVLNELVPDDPKAPFEVHNIIGRLVDDGDFLEVHRDFARNLWSVSAACRALWPGLWPTTPPKKPAPSTSTLPTRAPVSSVSATCSTSRLSRWWTSLDSCPASPRSVAGSSATERRCCSPTPQPLCRS